MREILAAAGLVATLLAPQATATASAGDTPPDKGVGIEVLNVNGSGCKQGSTATALSADNAAFTVTYSSYAAQAGRGAAKNDASRDCRLNLKVTPPSGFTYAVDNADYRGFAQLASGATATQYAVYYFNGTTKPPYRSHTMVGPFSDNWQVTDGGDGSALLYGPCGGSRVLSIDTRIDVDPGTSDPSALNMIAMDSADGSVRTTYRFAWKRCAS